MKKWKAVADAENEVDKRMERKKRELQLKQAELKKDLWVSSGCFRVKRSSCHINNFLSYID